jgi:hypothetical protein
MYCKVYSVLAADRSVDYVSYACCVKVHSGAISTASKQAEQQECTISSELIIFLFYIQFLQFCIEVHFVVSYVNLF